MYAEITLKHEDLYQPVLAKSLEHPSLGASMTPDQVKSRSKIYGGDRIIGFDAAIDRGGETLVLARWLDGTRSSFHVERTDDVISRLRDDVEQVSTNLLKVLNHNKVGAKLWIVRMFEDNGCETGLQATKITLGDIIRDELKATKMAGPATALLTAVTFYSFSLEKQNELARAIVSFLIGVGIALFTSLVRVFFAFLGSRRKLKFRFEG